MESAKPSEVILQRIEDIEVKPPLQEVVLPRMFRHDSLGKELPSAATLDLQSLVSSLNYIHFMEMPVFLQLAHPKYQDSILVEAYPEPCDGCELTCRWTEKSLAGPDIRKYRFLNLILDDGQSIILVPVTLRSVNNTGFTVELSGKGYVTGKRRARRYPCRDVKVTFSQGGFLARGELLDFSPSGFRVRVGPELHCSFHDLNSESPFFLQLHRDGRTLFSEPCRIVRQGSGTREREIVLAPDGTRVNRFKKRQIRSPRYILKPRPLLIFDHPLLHRTLRLEGLDISFSGVSVNEESGSGVLVPGLIIPEMTIEFPGSQGMKSVAQVIYRQEGPEGQGRCGIAILDMDMADYSRLADVLINFTHSEGPLSTHLDLDELWEFFFKTGAIEPDTYRIIEPHKGQLKEALTKSHLASPEVAKHIVYRDKGQIIGYASLMRAYEKAWLISQHLIPGEDSEGAALDLLDQVMSYLFDMHRLPSGEANYVMRCFQSGDAFSKRLHEDFTIAIGNPRVCSLDHFSCLSLQKGGNRDTVPGGWSLDRCSRMDLWELGQFYGHSSGGLLLDALSLDIEGPGSNGLGQVFGRLGLFRDMSTYALRHEGNLCAVFYANQTDYAFEAFHPLNSLIIMIINPSHLPRDILFKAISQSVRSYEHRDRVDVMVYPHGYLQENGVPCERQVKSWILNLSHMESYIEHIRNIDVHRKSSPQSRGDSLSKAVHHRGNGMDLETVGALAGGVAHNFNNLLMGIQGHASLLLMDTDPSDPRFKHIKGIEDCVKDASSLTKDLLGFAGGGKYEVRPTNLNTLIERSVLMFRKRAPGVRIHTRYEKDIWIVDADQDQMTRSLLNLYKNAWEAMPGGGDLHLETKNIRLGKGPDLPPDLPPGRYVKIIAKDSGVGMDQATQERCFAPFFTTKGVGKAMGMGLAAVYGVIRNHRGFIKLKSTPGEGTTFTIHLPCSNMKA